MQQHWLFFSIAAHTTAFVTPVVEHWLEREIAHRSTVRDRSNNLSHHGTTSHSLDINEGRKEMFYLTTHSTHFIFGYMASDMVKNHTR